ncbi:chaperonin 10-like protein [Cyathus striatus]|nr:chaperonin 10-like protein [Cyathus striatus]
MRSGIRRESDRWGHDLLPSSLAPKTHHHHVSIALPSQTAVVLYGPKDLRVEERTVWPPSQGYAQVAVKSTGLCGSDQHYYTHGRNGDFAVRQPLVLGHEAAGIVTARVAIEAGIMCRNCDFCKKGRYNLCKSMRFCSSASVYPHNDGTLQSRMNHPAHVLHPLLLLELAALAEPLSVLIHASRRANLQSGQSVLVFGVEHGASRVVAVDINQARLDFALENGFAQQTYCVSAGDRAKTSDDQLRRAKETASTALDAFGQKEGFDVVFECTGAEACIQMSIHAAITGGKVTLIGMGSRNVLLPLSTAALREVDIHGSFRYANTYPTPSPSCHRQATECRQARHTSLPLRDASSAFELVGRGVDENGGLVLKVMVEA